MTDDEIGPTVIVQVADRQPAAGFGDTEEFAPLTTHVLEKTLPPGFHIVKEHRSLVQGAPADQGVLKDVAIDDDEILPAVLVHVQEPRPPTHQVLPDKRRP